MAIVPPTVKRALGMATDVGFLLEARRALLPLPLVDRAPATPPVVFEPFELRPNRDLRDQRIAVIGSAGAGDAVALVGVRRAFEEAGVEPEAISVCGGSVLFGAMWAAGMSSDEMAEFSLSWRPQDYLDIQWGRLPHFALSALRGYGGLAKGEAVERLFDRRLWHMSAGETEIALHTAVYAIGSGRVEYFGSAETPHLTLGELVRIAVAQPLLADAVRVEGQLYVDGGAIDALPAEPIVADGDFDRVFALDLLAARGPLEPARAELVRRGREHLGASFVPIVPISRDAVHGFPFYDLFLDRRRWPELMRRGYTAARGALS